MTGSEPENSTHQAQNAVLLPEITAPVDEHGEIGITENAPRSFSTATGQPSATGPQFSEFTDGNQDGQIGALSDRHRGGEVRKQPRQRRQHSQCSEISITTADSEEERKELSSSFKRQPSSSGGSPRWSVSESSKNEDNTESSDGRRQSVAASTRSNHNSTDREMSRVNEGLEDSEEVDDRHPNDTAEQRAFRKLYLHFDEYIDVPYPIRHPLDNESQNLYHFIGQSQFRRFLDSMRDGQNWLPPNDGRGSLLHCTKERYMARFLKALYLAIVNDTPGLERPGSEPTGNSVDEKIKSIEPTLRPPLTVDNELQKVWIMDYDDQGNSVRWDLASHPTLYNRYNYVAIDNLPADFQFATWEWPTKWYDLFENAPRDSPSLYTPPKHPCAPWYRFIFIRGLPQLICPFETVQGDGVSRNPWVQMNDRIASLNMHESSYTPGSSTSLYERRTSAETQSSVFHISFYQILGEETKVPKTTWPSGKLYASDRMVQFQSITLEAVCGAGRSNPIQDTDKYWTISYLVPPEFQFQYRGQDSDHTLLFKQSVPSLKLLYLTLVTGGLGYAAEAWETIARYFDELLDEERFLLSEKDHDTLLFDDSTFKRSRIFFWAINALPNFMKKITEATKAFDSYQKKEFLDIDQATAEEIRSIRYQWDKALLEAERLQAVLEQFQSHFERAKLMRDGLFNASAVMEAKTSSRLGENVKLLTYVSIFYLPLSFCTSMWSTTETFSFRGLAIAMTLIGAATYLVVFNLNHLVRVGRAKHKAFRQSVIQRLRKETWTEGWRERVEGFDRFEPDPGDQKPSDWYILLGAIWLIPDTLGFVFLQSQAAFSSKFLYRKFKGAFRRNGEVVAYVQTTSRGDNTIELSGEPKSPAERGPFGRTHAPFLEGIEEGTDEVNEAGSTISKRHNLGKEPAALQTSQATGAVDLKVAAPVSRESSIIRDRTDTDPLPPVQPSLDKVSEENPRGNWLGRTVVRLKGKSLKERNTDEIQEEVV